MRYILKDGYIDEISFGATIECKNQTCTEYTGTIPAGYTSLQEWVIGEDGKLNAWKMVDGNLVFDSDKYKELQNKYKLEEEDYALATKKYVNDKISNNSQVVIDELSANVEGSSCIPITDSGDYEIAKMKLTSLGTKTNKEGTNVTLEDSRGDDLAKLTLDGRSTQEGTPTPDNLIEIESIGGIVQYKQTGDNIFNKNGVSVLMNAKKDVLDTGVRATVSVAGNYRYVAIKLGDSELSGKKITIQTKITPSANNQGQLSLFYGTSTMLNSQYRIVNVYTSSPTTASILDTFPNNFDTIWCCFYANLTGTGNVGDYVDYTDLMIVIGDTIDNYKSYQETILNIDLQGNKLCSLANGVKDELIVENGRAKIIKRVQEDLIDGVNKIIVGRSLHDSSTYLTCNYSNPNIKKIASGYIVIPYSNKFKSSSIHGTWQGIDLYGVSQAYNGHYLQFSFPKDIFTDFTLNSINSWFASNNVKVQYELETPQTIDLGEVTMPKTFEGVNNISNSEDTNMSVDYIKDITENPIKLIVSNENLLNISALTTSKSGIDFAISKGTIKLNGTATENIELILDGSLDNTDMLFLIKENTDYYLNGLATGINLNLYNFDGTNRTLINSLNAGLMNLSNANKVTCTSLSIASGTTFNDITISPMLEINSAASPFKMHEENKLTINTSFTKNDDLVIEKSEVKLNDEVIQHCDMPITYKPCVFMLDKSIQASIDYFKEKTLDNRFASIDANIEGIVLNVSKTYMTKTDGAILVNSAKEEAIDSANASTNTKLENYSTTVEMNSAISASASEINLEVAKKVNNEDFTHAQIVAKINDDTSDVLISSDKLDVDAIATFTNSKLAEAGSTTINGANISTGTISAATIKLKNVTLTPSSSKIGGWTINSNQLVSSNSTGNSTINANGEIYFYPTSGGILGLNNGFRLKAPYGIAIYNDTATYESNTIQKGITLLADSGNLVLAQKSESNSVSIRSYCSPSVRSTPAARCLLLAAAQDIFFYAHNTGTIWVQGNSLANSRVLTNAGASSSRNVKKNIVKFEQSKYDKALNLLNKMNLYDYDYKYNIYKNSHKYGFIIDELEELEEAKDFFEFEEYNATVKDDKIDFSGAMEGEKLTTKNYDSNVLDKYMLTCIKALLIKVDTLEKRIEELEKM